MKIAVIGASGFLGSKVYAELQEEHEVVGTYFTKPLDGLIRLDATDRDAVGSFMERQTPDLVLFCAGLTSTDFCEQHREAAFDANVKGARAVCETADCKVVYFSTDYVFDGEKGQYSEIDSPNPVNFYGITKLLAEQSVLSNSNNLVIRVSGLFGVSELNNRFMEGIKTSQITACTDLFSSPTFIEDIPSNLGVLSEKKGILHFTGPERLSRYEFTTRVVERLGITTKVIPIQSKDAGFIARRPKDTSLVSNVFNTQMTELNSALSKMRRELNGKDA